MKVKQFVPMLVLSSLLTSHVFAATAAKPSDNEISKVVETVNEGEIKLAEYAVKTSKNAEVKKFAEHMITDHKMNKEKANALGVTPLENTKSMAMRKDGENSMEKLKKLQGKDFDKAYINDQLAAHEKVLGELKSNLIPHAKNKDLKAHLEMTSKKVESHIEHAKMIQKTL